MPDPTSERPSDMKRRAWKLLQEASAYASTLGGDAQREEKERLLEIAQRLLDECERMHRTFLCTTRRRPRAHRKATH